MAAKIAGATPQPGVTIRVYGGLVEEIAAIPFPCASSTTISTVWTTSHSTRTAAPV